MTQRTHVTSVTISSIPQKERESTYASITASKVSSNSVGRKHGLTQNVQMVLTAGEQNAACAGSNTLSP